MISRGLARMKATENPLINKFGCYFSWLWLFRYMYIGMVKKEFKGRYRNSVLGYFWHLLTPIVLIITYYVMFNVIFGKGIPNYWLYLSSGVFAFSVLMGSITGGCGMMISSAGMITKTVFPREIIVFAKVTVNIITALISYAIIILLSLTTGGLTINIMLFPLCVILLFLMSSGIALLLSSVCVYYRDLQYVISSISICFMFATPIFYIPNQINNELLHMINVVNPLTYMVEAFHNVIYYGNEVFTINFLICFFISVLIFILGLFVFKKLEKNFAERL